MLTMLAASTIPRGKGQATSRPSARPRLFVLELSSTSRTVLKDPIPVYQSQKHSDEQVLFWTIMYKIKWKYHHNMVNGVFCDINTKHHLCWCNSMVQYTTHKLTHRSAFCYWWVWSACAWPANNRTKGRCVLSNITQHICHAATLRSGHYNIVNKQRLASNIGPLHWNQALFMCTDETANSWATASGVHVCMPAFRSKSCGWPIMTQLQSQTTGVALTCTSSCLVSRSKETIRGWCPPITSVPGAVSNIHCMLHRDGLLSQFKWTNTQTNLVIQSIEHKVNGCHVNTFTA